MKENININPQASTDNLCPVDLQVTLPPKRIISVSGGKDSTALALWAKENLKDFTPVFCDTHWEHEITYAYLGYLNDKLFEGKLEIVSSNKYKSFQEMCIKKKRVPSTMARFCTEELKLKPMKKFIEQFLPNVEIYVGVRADESFSRSKLPERAFADYYGCDMIRPLIKWSAEDCFDIMKKHNIEPNPLYKMGMKRVGCMPCIMVSKPELKNILNQFPEVVAKIAAIEKQLGRTFFPPKFIPDRYCSKRDEKTGVPICFIEDVVKYVRDDPDQIKMFDEPEGESCMSYYSICE